MQGGPSTANTGEHTSLTWINQALAGTVRQPTQPVVAPTLGHHATVRPNIHRPTRPPTTKHAKTMRMSPEVHKIVWPTARPEPPVKLLKQGPPRRDPEGSLKALRRGSLNGRTGHDSTYKDHLSVYAAITHELSRKSFANCICDGGMLRNLPCVPSCQQLAWTKHVCH